MNNLIIIKSPKNLGFCGGNNLGFKYAKGQYIVLLNQDTWVDRHWLENLVKDAENHADVAIFQSKILYPDGKIRTFGNLLDIYGMFACRKRYKNDLGQYDNDCYSFFYASGASILIRSDFFESIGGFDEKLFMYADDIDICWIARLKGFKIKLTPSSICYHLNGEFLSITPKKFYFMSRNRIRILIKNYSIYNAMKRVPIAILLIGISAIFLTLKKRDPKYLWMYIKALSWNLKNLRNTLSYRKKIQLQRKIKDNEIEKYMIKYPLELFYYPKIIKRVSSTKDGRI